MFEDLRKYFCAALMTATAAIISTDAHLEEDPPPPTTTVFLDVVGSTRRLPSITDSAHQSAASALPAMPGPSRRRYPGAYPNVIAVTATDVDDKLFGANRGK